MEAADVWREDSPGGRVYAVKLPDGSVRRLPSVTTLLSRVQDGRLDDMIRDMGRARFDEITHRAALRGTSMHRFLENYLVAAKAGSDGAECLREAQRKTPTDLLAEGMPQDRIDKGRDLFYNFYHAGMVAEAAERVIATEQYVYSLEHGYAGTTDLVMSSPDGPVIVDFKSSSRPKAPSDISRYRLQVAAYAHAYAEMTGATPCRGEIWISAESTTVPSRFVVPREECDALLAQFTTLCQEYHEAPL